MRRREAEIAATVELLDGLLDELEATMAALTARLASRPGGAEEMSPR